MPAGPIGASAARAATHLDDRRDLVTDWPFVPCVRLRRGRVLVDLSEGFSDDYRDVETGIIELDFDYGGVRFGAEHDDAGVPLASGYPRVVRDLEAETDVRRILEGLGAIDLGCLEDCVPAPGVRVDYAVDVEGDPDVLCTFVTQALPRLRALGWRVEVDDDYPCQVVEGALWYANLGVADDNRDWFELELGVEVDGQRVDLLPVLLDLIEQRALHSVLHGTRRTKAVHLGGRRYLQVPLERLRAIARVLAELYEIEGPVEGTLRLPKLVPNYLERIGEALEGATVRWGGDTALADRLRALGQGPSARAVEPPRGLRATLRPYQAAGLAWLQNLRAHEAGGILADDMGLGKTLQTIAHLVVEREAGRLREPALVVAPTSLIGNWKREIRKFAPSLRVMVLHGPGRRRLLPHLHEADVVVTTYGLLCRDQEALSARAYHMLILDEAQTIKNVRSQVHGAVKRIEARHRLCLTGTPIENNLEELWALFDFLMPGLLGDAGQFRSAFAHPIQRQNNRERLEVLRHRIAPFVLRRMKDKVASELPPKTEIVRPVELRGRQRDLYESIRIAAHAAVRRAVRKKGIAASTIDILGALMKLRQACCDPRLVPISAAREVEESAKLDLFFEMLDELLPQGRKILVFSQFTSMLALIGEQLRRRNVRYCAITGATSDRQAQVDAFQHGDIPVFLISLKAGGTGLNLTAADTVIHYDPWWNPAAQAQATDRAYRIGQTRPVFVYNLIVAGSVEERMLNLQKHKQALAQTLLAQHDGATIELTEREVDQLFAPLR